MLFFESNFEMACDEEAKRAKDKITKEFLLFLPSLPFRFPPSSIGSNY
jgi:hypothetical protein